MKNHLKMFLGLGFALLSAPVISPAGVVNGSFESWDLLGWSLHSDTGSRAVEPFTRSAGMARTVSSWGSGLGLETEITPQIGHRFLRMSTRAQGNFLGDNTYEIFVSQTFTLNQGEVLSGWSWFYNGDSEPLDSAWVRILDAEGGLIGAPWLQTSGGGLSALAIAPAPDWNLWEWAAPTTASYTLQLGMTTSGANNEASYGLFDGITVSAAVVPEPSVIAMAIIGGLGLLALRNRTR